MSERTIGSQDAARYFDLVIQLAVIQHPER